MIPQNYTLPLTSSHASKERKLGCDFSKNTVQFPIKEWMGNRGSHWITFLREQTEDTKYSLESTTGKSRFRVLQIPRCTDTAKATKVRLLRAILDNYGVRTQIYILSSHKSLQFLWRETSSPLPRVLSSLFSPSPLSFSFFLTSY